MTNTKYVFVTGGVVSALGKGITSASIGMLLKANSYDVSVIKLDPYINIDPGTMSPQEHGEVFVTDDGAETDLDLGHYERFININLSSFNSVSTGKIYQSVLNKERRGDYLGKTIQVVPHVTDEIKNRITKIGKDSNSDVVIVELGGTVGDIESYPYIEAIRQLRAEMEGDTAYIHCTLVPYLDKAGELKSKPTQQSLKELRGLGIIPDFVVCRSKIELTTEIAKKIALFGNVKEKNIISAIDVNHIYQIPINFAQQDFDKKILKTVDLRYDYFTGDDLIEWHSMVSKLKTIDKEITVAIVGKYVELHDAYISIAESLQHAGLNNSVDINIKYIDSSKISGPMADDLHEIFKGVDGILVPGGFGERGIEGKIWAAWYARTKKIPYFGICLGMQIAVIEFARNVLGYTHANSTEFEKTTPYPVIDLMETQKDVENKGGTMRLGLYPCKLKKESISEKTYQEELIYERHRHRWEFNNEYKSEFIDKGMDITGQSPDCRLVEIVENRNHPWFVGVQFHPEFKSRPLKPHPLFDSFIKAMI